MRRAAARALAFTIAIGLPLAGLAAERSVPAAPTEPLWKTVVLAPGRVVANGRFDAAEPAYVAERAEKKATLEAERAAACPCACGTR
jgi:hypothetical protein